MQPSNTDSSSSERSLRECLASLGLPSGLVSAALQSHQSCDSQLWLLDNSSRMKVPDSHTIGRTGGKEAGSIKRVDNVTRWEELKDCVGFHAGMASQCFIPTKYWLVNDPAKSGVKWKRQQDLQMHSQQFNLCARTPEGVSGEMEKIKHIMNNVTLDQMQCPLTSCIQSLSKSLAKGAPGLSARGRHVTLVICTQGRPLDKDGEAGDGLLQEFHDELSSLTKLPVKIIIRLCTDNEKVRDVFTTLDNKFHQIDVLDDFWGESRQVYLCNPWLTYTMGFHRLRESGLAPRVLDRINQEPLSLEEIHSLCTLLFSEGNGHTGLPHPQQNWDGFLRELKVLVSKEKPQWNSMKKKLTPLIDLKKLKAMHSGGDSSRHLRHSWYKKFSQQKTAANSADTQQRKPLSPKQPHARKTISNGKDSNLTLPEILKRWSHQPPDYGLYYPLQHLLVTVPQTFPPTNTKVEPHEYFSKWKMFDEEAFADETGDQLKELLKRAVRKAKFFLHPDKLPNDLTENQTLLFNTLWYVIKDREAVYLS